MVVPQMRVFEVFDAFDAYVELKIGRFLTRTTYGLCTDHLRTIYEPVICCRLSVIGCRLSVVGFLLSVVCCGFSVVGWWLLNQTLRLIATAFR